MGPLPEQVRSCTTAPATAALAGLGWARLTAGLGRRRTAATAAVLLAAGLVAPMSRRRGLGCRFLPRALVQSRRDVDDVVCIPRRRSRDCPASMRPAHGSIVLVSVLALTLGREQIRRFLAGDAPVLASIVMTADLKMAMRGSC